jgi:DNA-binding XRE family transcriptional regulator
MATTTKTLLPLHTNPVRRARERLGYSLSEVAGHAEVNSQTWYLAECAVFTDPPPAIMKFLEDEGFNLIKLEWDYHDYVRRQRAEFYMNYYKLYPRLAEFQVGGVHPLRVLYSTFGITRQGLAKELCVQPAILHKLETGKQKKCPAQLHAALLEVGITQTSIKRFTEELERWAS